MSISYQQTKNLDASAQITYENMREYYEHYSVDWQVEQIEAQIGDLENYDILFKNELVGAIRLAFDEEGCYIRDLQIIAEHQNKGLGAQALSFCMQEAKNKKVNTLRLRVFKISPAHHLYTRFGFTIDKDEERFYYMSCSVS